MKKILLQHKRNKLKKSLNSFIFIFIISILIGSFIYIDNKLRPTITVIAETKAIELANRSINKAVANIVDENIEYEDLIYVKTGDNGNIKMMQANSILMNEIASKVALEIQSEMKKIKTTSTYIPIGTVTVDFGTDFESSGINQTRHRIYLKSTTQVKVVVPLTTSTKEIKTQIPICETIIVGDVPQNYVNIPEDGVIDILPEVQ